ncbi:hypothetical protein SUNI508_02485 [Seiridium unicorne]|uniref:Rhodopsin domain-containing protein n=1 Tax=Seiridium unicorne TaxID=138068 RepID=A0ABR2UFL3_9PEZI
MSALVAELWTWLAVTIVVVIARILSRRMLYGSFRKLQIDDFIMVLAVVAAIVLSVGVYILTYTPSNLIRNVDEVDLTPDDIALREYGSKMVIVVEQMQIFVIWSVKVCLLIMYSRLTTSLKQNLFVKITAGYAALGFVVMEILFFAAWCRPFWHYWQVPTDNINCSMERDHLITNTVFNISSDLMIIALPMPVFFKAQLPPKRKAVLIGVFALGLFTILSAVLSKAYSFGDPYGTDWIVWYIREANTAIIVANLPFTWTLLQRIFNLRSFHGKSTGNTPAATSRFRSTYGNLTSHNRAGEKRKDDLDISPSESQEQINGYGIALKIYQQNEVHITSEEVDARSGHQTPPEGIPASAGASFAVNGNPTRHENDDMSSTQEVDMGTVTTVGRGL